MRINFEILAIFVIFLAVGFSQDNSENNEKKISIGSKLMSAVKSKLEDAKNSNLASIINNPIKLSNVEIPALERSPLGSDEEDEFDESSEEFDESSEDEEDDSEESDEFDESDDESDDESSEMEEMDVEQPVTSVAGDKQIAVDSIATNSGGKVKGLSIKINGRRFRFRPCDCNRLQRKREKLKRKAEKWVKSVSKATSCLTDRWLERWLGAENATAFRECATDFFSSLDASNAVGTEVLASIREECNLPIDEDEYVQHAVGNAWGNLNGKAFINYYKMMLGLYCRNRPVAASVAEAAVSADSAPQPSTSRRKRQTTEDSDSLCPQEPPIAIRCADGTIDDDGVITTNLTSEETYFDLPQNNVEYKLLGGCDVCPPKEDRCADACLRFFGGSYRNGNCKDIDGDNQNECICSIAPINVCPEEYYEQSTEECLFNYPNPSPAPYTTFNSRCILHSGARLPIILNQEQWENLIAFADQSGLKKDKQWFWIGLTRDDNEAVEDLKWVDGAPANASEYISLEGGEPWGENEPDGMFNLNTTLGGEGNFCGNASTCATSVNAMYLANISKWVLSDDLYFQQQGFNIEAGLICQKPAAPALEIDMMERWLNVYPDWEPPVTEPPTTTTSATETTTAGGSDTTAVGTTTTAPTNSTSPPDDDEDCEYDPNPCNPNTDYILKNGKLCFRLIRQKLPWFHAEARCAALGGRLASFANADIYKEVHENYLSKAGSPGYLKKDGNVATPWLALQNTEDSGDEERSYWFGSDGKVLSKLTYKLENLGIGLKWRLNRAAFNAKCVRMDSGSDAWDNQPCQNGYDFICEFKNRRVSLDEDNEDEEDDNDNDDGKECRRRRWRCCGRCKRIKKLGRKVRNTWKRRFQRLRDRIQDYKKKVKTIRKRHRDQRNKNSGDSEDSEGCAKGWKRAGGFCVQVSKNKKRHDKAIDDCKKAGGELFEGTAEEVQQLSDHLRGRGMSWVNIVDGKWASGGTEVDDSLWHPRMSALRKRLEKMKRKLTTCGYVIKKGKRDNAEVMLLERPCRGRLNYVCRAPLANN